MGDVWFRQEYECSFELPAGAVYPQWSKCLRPGLDQRSRHTPCAVIGDGTRSVPTTPTVGGIDFGFRNPFAAIWGYVAGGDVLCIIGERYGSGQPTEDHVPFLPRRCLWYCDPSAPGEIQRLRRMDVKAIKANNAIREGIAAVSGRIQSGRLMINPERCPMLAFEGGLYHYDPDESIKSENPVDQDNHALSALRYLVMGLARRSSGRKVTEAETPKSAGNSTLHDEACWQGLTP
jgi:hypothetical protein